MAGFKPTPVHKVILVGDATAGKSNILLRFADNTFTPSYISTIGIDFKIKQLQDVKLQMWDTAGQERFRTLTTAYYRGANTVCICVDATKDDDESRARIKYWQQQIQDHAPDAKVNLVLTKADLVGDTAVLAEKQRILAAALGVEPSEVVVCSAATGLGLENDGVFAQKIESDWRARQAAAEADRQLVDAQQHASTWGSTVTDAEVKKMLQQLKAELDKYEKHLEAAYQKHKKNSEDSTLPNKLADTTSFTQTYHVSSRDTDNLRLLVQKQRVVESLRSDLDAASRATPRSETQFQALNAFSATLQREANVLNKRRDPFRNHTEQSLIKLAKILAACSIGIGLLAAMAVSKITTGRAYFWRTSGSDMAENMKDSLEKGQVISPRSRSNF